MPGEIQIARVEGADFEYLTIPTKTEAARVAAEYFTVGDIGFLDDDGYLFVTDRSDDLILRGGVNVYPAEIEAALLTHPGVRDAAVVGVPDEEWGELVVAAVERDGAGGDEDAFLAALAAHCAGELAGFKCPDRIEVTDSLPRGDNGKLHRRTVRDRMRDAARPQAGVGSSTPTEGI